ncbi:MAG TPA: hypothetical protein VNE39_05180 [Planctomycetota bacterium]|nr:hypothetical protein [Planctomycetota bacterium]
MPVACPTIRNLLACGAWLAACGLPACSRPRAPQAWQPREFLIALRGAPPPKPQHYALVAQAGFTVIGEGVGSDALDLARRHGLRVALGQIGLDPRTLHDRGNERGVAEAIRRFRTHPALWGYFVGDEMLEAQLPDIVSLAAFARQHDPAHPLLVSLLPSDAWVGPALATGDYAGYVERFVAAVRPALLNFGYFPFREKGDGEFYFENLEIIRRAALAHGLPFYPTLQAASWAGMRPPGEGELRWLAYTALAYGAKGVVWFRYWGAPAGSRLGIVEPDGLATERYRAVAALNAELRALGPTLMRLRSLAVCHTGTVPVGATRLPVHGLVASVEGGAFVVGEFEGEKGERHVLVVNKDYARAVTAKLTLNRPCRGLSRLDASSGQWVALAATADRFRTTAEFSLPPGGGRLLRLGQ